MRHAEKITIAAGLSGFSLMSNAGKAVFELIIAELQPDDHVLIACGTGNNGGDGLVVASLLAAEGVKVTVALTGSSDSVTGDAATALQQLPQATVAISTINPNDFTLVVDAILGAGLSRPIVGELANWINSLNYSGVRTISIDIPSGVHGDTGQAWGTAVHAHQTATFFLKKPGHLLCPGRELCGTTVVMAIGLDYSILDTLQPSIYENAQPLWQSRLTQPHWYSHKYTRGHAVVFSGGMTSTGAARLAAAAALRTGAGLVTVASPVSAAAVNAAHLTNEMLILINTPEELQALFEEGRVASVLLGPGMGVGEQTRAMVAAALGRAPAVVLDADALTSFAKCPQELFDLIAAAQGQVVLTPHQGEFRCLFGPLADAAPENLHEAKTRRATRASQLCGCVVLYKGSDTVVASPQGDCVINTNAPPWLATAGSGDVLAGTITGWMAQGLDAFDAACVGCWMHAEAATGFGPGMVASDIASGYPEVLAGLLVQSD